MEELYLELERDWGWKKDVVAFKMDGDHEFFRACLKAFSHDFTFERLLKACKKKDYDDLLIQAHTLKGVSLNLGLSMMGEDLGKLVEKLKEHDHENIDELVSRISQWQSRLEFLCAKMDL